MLNASGVTRGHVVRPSDVTTPRRIVFVQCVGARGEAGRPYCSRFCCMNAVKDSMLLRQHDPTVEEVTILYTDLRAFGKGFDDFLRRSFEAKLRTCLRGRPSKIEGDAPASRSRSSSKTPWGRAHGASRPTWWCCPWRRRPRTAPRELAANLGIDMISTASSPDRTPRSRRSRRAARASSSAARDRARRSSPTAWRRPPPPRRAPWLCLADARRSKRTTPHEKPTSETAADRRDHLPLRYDIARDVDVEETGRRGRTKPGVVVAKDTYSPAGHRTGPHRRR